MTVFYGIACLFSVLMLGLYFAVDKKREKWLMFLFVSIFVCNTGYFMLSLSNGIAIALISNAIAYAGNVFLPFFMLMLILDACNIKSSNLLVKTLLIVGIIVLFIATSGGYLPIYYKEVSLEITASGTILKKVYGPLHILYFVYLFGYMASMMTVIVYALIKKKMTTTMHSIFLSVIVFGNILVWLIEQFMGNKFEFLCVSYIFNELLLLLLYGLLREYENHKTKEVELSVLDCKDKMTKEQVAVVFAKYKKLAELTAREKEVLKHILFGEKRKEIAGNLFITESAVRKHTSNIFKKLDVNSRAELFEKLKQI